MTDQPSIGDILSGKVAEEMNRAADALIARIDAEPGT